MYTADHRHEPIKIGIDFDNTIVNYSKAFYKIAVEKNLIPHDIDPSKASVKSYLCSHGKEEVWTNLQGYIYGKKMELASPYPGVCSFIDWSTTRSFSLAVISHKTLFPYKGPKYNLHTSAKNWVDTIESLRDIPLYFETTLTKKLEKIASLGCDYFIDDLPELLEKTSFPCNVEKILFDPNKIHLEKPYLTFHSWDEITQFFTKKIA